jgi:hypothetical protein
MSLHQEIYVAENNPPKKAAEENGTYITEHITNKMLKKDALVSEDPYLYNPNTVQIKESSRRIAIGGPQKSREKLQKNAEKLRFFMGNCRREKFQFL